MTPEPCWVRSYQWGKRGAASSHCSQPTRSAAWAAAATLPWWRFRDGCEGAPPHTTMTTFLFPFSQRPEAQPSLKLVESPSTEVSKELDREWGVLDHFNGNPCHYILDIVFSKNLPMSVFPDARVSESLAEFVFTWLQPRPLTWSLGVRAPAILFLIFFSFFLCSVDFSAE